KGEHDVAVIDLAPAQFALQRRLEDPDHLAIDVIDRGGQEQQPADRPAHAADASGNSARYRRPDLHHFGHDALRSWDCGGEWRTRGDRAARPRSARLTPPAALRPSGDPPPRRGTRFAR